MLRHDTTHPITGYGLDTDFSPLAPLDSTLFPALTDPWTTGPEAVSVAVAPPTVAPVLKDVLYLSEVPGQPAISVSDINQGQIGDCFLLSSIGEIALLKPQDVMNMIHANANGTEAVTLYTANNGQIPAAFATSYKPVVETVTNVFPSYAVNSGPTQDVLNGQKEIWVQVLEKAVATLGGGYGSIANGGSPIIAMEVLTGHAAGYVAPANLTLASLIADQAANDMLVFDTKSSGALTNGLVNSHAYMFEGVTGSGAAAMVHLGNPWGFDQPTAIAFSTLSKSIAEIDIGHLA